MSTTATKGGGRRIELFVPFDFIGERVEAIDIAPAKLDHLLKWQAGKYRTTLALLAELTGHNEATLRQVTFPDADRMMAEFMVVLPEGIRADIQSGRIPVFDPDADPEPKVDVPLTPPDLAPSGMAEDYVDGIDDPIPEDNGGIDLNGPDGS